MSIASATGRGAEEAHDIRDERDQLRTKLAIVEAERDTYRSCIENICAWLDGHATTEEIRMVLAEHRKGWK